MCRSIDCWSYQGLCHILNFNHASSQLFLLQKESKLIMGWSAFSFYYLIASLYFIIMDSIRISEKIEPILLLIIHVFDLIIQIYFWICTFSLYGEFSSECKEAAFTKPSKHFNEDAEAIKMKELNSAPIPRYNPPVKLVREESVSYRESNGYENKSVIDNSKMNENIRQQVSGRVGMLKEQFSVPDSKPTPPLRPTVVRKPTILRPPSKLFQDEDEELYLEFD